MDTGDKITFLGAFSRCLPSGNHTKSYWTWPFIVIVDLPINSMVIFHSYVSPFTRPGNFRGMGSTYFSAVENTGSVQNNPAQQSHRRIIFQTWFIDVIINIYICICKYNMQFICQCTLLYIHSSLNGHRYGHPNAQNQAWQALHGQGTSSDCTFQWRGFPFGSTCNGTCQGGL